MGRTKGFLRIHLIPILISLAITSLAFMVFPLASFVLTSKTVPVVPAHTVQIRGYYANFRSYSSAEYAFRDALEDNSTVVFVGSSELTSKELEAIPFNFFNQYLKYPALCIGHAGNQSLNMLSFLAANRSCFRKTKLVILISPTWFMSSPARGTSLESFLEFNSDRFLTALDNDPGIPAVTREYIYHYVALNIENINSSSSIQKLIAYKYSAGRNWLSGIAYAPFIFYYKSLINIDSSIRKFIGKKNIDTIKDTFAILQAGFRPTMPATIPWDSLYNSGLEAGRKLAGNNHWGIDSNYYNNYVHGRKFSLLTVPFRYNREYRDYCTLLDFLSGLDCKPLIIIQPLNPYVYEGLPDFKPVMDQVAKVAEDHHFACLNLFVKDTAQYTKGDLKDVMHLGNPGWYKVDRFVIDNYFPVQTSKPFINQ